MGIGVLASCLVVALAAQSETQSDPVQKTTRDGVYTKAQAERGKAAFTSVCAACHSLEAAASGLEGPPLGGEAFFTNWADQNVYTLVTQIMLSMPPDGSVILGPEETADLIAYILQVNKLPEGQADLKADASARDITIVAPGSGGGWRR